MQQKHLTYLFQMQTQLITLNDFVDNIKDYVDV